MRTRPSDLYLGVVNNKQWGGAFVSHDGGLSWSQRAQGLDGHGMCSAWRRRATARWWRARRTGCSGMTRTQQVWKRTGAIGAAMVEHSRRPVHGKTAAATGAGEGRLLVKTGRQIEGTGDGAGAGGRAAVCGDLGGRVCERESDGGVDARGWGGSRMRSRGGMRCGLARAW